MLLFLDANNSGLNGDDHILKLKLHLADITASVLTLRVQLHVSHELVIGVWAAILAERGRAQHEVHVRGG